MDFKTIKEEYETTKTSFKKLATKYETHYKKIERMAKKEKWVKFIPKNNPTATAPKPNQPPIKIQSIVSEAEKATMDIKELLNNYHEPIDDILIMTYIDSYISFRELQEAVKTEGKFILSSKGSEYMNPKYSALQMEKMNLVKIGKELGVTISSRIRLRLDLQKDNQQGTIFDIVDNLMDEEIEI